MGDKRAVHRRLKRRDCRLVPSSSTLARHALVPLLIATFRRIFWTSAGARDCGKAVKERSWYHFVYLIIIHFLFESLIICWITCFTTFFIKSFLHILWTLPLLFFYEVKKWDYCILYLFIFCFFVKVIIHTFIYLCKSWIHLLMFRIYPDISCPCILVVNLKKKKKIIHKLTVK